jgi:hypothetical protein
MLPAIQGPPLLDDWEQHIGDFRNVVGLKIIVSSFTVRKGSIRQWIIGVEALRFLKRS